MRGDRTRFYKVEREGDKDVGLLGDLIQFAQERNIGLVSRGFSALEYSNDKALYFSYSPGQISHPSVKERSTESLIEEFEGRLNESGLRWTTFDLGTLLSKVRIPPTSSE